ncbi:F-box/kelch-repeat protein At5g15710-like [Abrus precatorius]|uniref:F-box/kelch-repeat protein At5g15710-like n=1 Tax=Abrus precatorius TaxID=3816 RepID=A0A8B8LGN8_ABRPR|nr:F-box/kelch-repeat protein At5g15710-like [Abrus precatorius]
MAGNRSLMFQQRKKTTQFDDLPRDLKIEIFCKLPYKYLMRCKCVSKEWFFLISRPNPCFLGWWTFMYSSFNGKRLKSACKDSDSVFKSHRFSFNFLPCYRRSKKKNMHVVHALKDLFLCFATHAVGLVEYYICNPLTQEWRALPPTKHGNNFCAHLMCDSHDGSKKFKVLQVLREISSHDILVLQIFSSGKWVQHNIKLKTHFRTHLIIKLIVCNGTLYAITRSLHTGILAVDLNSSSGYHNHVIKLPKVRSFQQHKIGPSLRVRQGRLCAVRVAIRTVPVLYIWELKKNHSVEVEGDEWNLLHCVSLARMKTTINREWFYNIVQRRLPLVDGEYNLFKILDFHPIDENVVYLRLHGRVASYDMVSKVLRFHPEFNFSDQKRLFPVVLPWLATPLHEW